MTLLLVKEKLDLSRGCQQWKVKVHKSCTISVGVCISSRSCGWWYCTTGCTLDNTKEDYTYGPQLESYSSMDFITVKLDVEARALSFAKNDAPLAVAFNDLPTGTFSPSVKISGSNVTRKDVQFIHDDGNSMDLITVPLEAEAEAHPPAPGPVAPKKVVADPGADVKAKEVPKSNGTARPKLEPDLPVRTPHSHDPETPKTDRPAGEDGARPKPAWVNTAGRLLNGSKPQTSWYKGHGPLFKTKKGSCSRCECLPCSDCVHSFQNIRDTLFTMLAKYHSDLDPSILLNYSLMFTGLKKNGDVKVDVHHRCCPKHKQRFISSLTINTCCRKHKVETCERIVQTLKDNAKTNKANDALHEAGNDLLNDLDDLETDDLDDHEEDEEDEEPHDFLDDGVSSSHTSDGLPTHKANGVAAAAEDGDPASRQTSTVSAGRQAPKSRTKPKTGAKGKKKRARR